VSIMNKKKIIFGLAIIVIVLLSIIQLKRSHDRITQISENLTPNEATVTVSNVLKKSASYSFEITGTVYPYKEIEVAAETQGVIKSLSVLLGQHIQKGAFIGIVDDKVKRLKYESSKIETERLKKDYERVKNLYNYGISSEQELDNALTTYEVAIKTLDENEKEYANTKLLSPIDGIITEKNVEEGSYVNVGTKMIKIVDMVKLKVKVNVPESNVYALKVGEQVSIMTDAYPDYKFTGKITFISPCGDESHNFPIEIELMNNTAYPLKAGTFITAKVDILSPNDALFIPREALQGSVKDARVYVAENGTAVLKNIVIGKNNGDKLEVINGLKETDKIIVSGQVNLTNGKAIKLMNNN
jgi:membrane fusion protein, multidrug efflux system